MITASQYEENDGEDDVTYQFCCNKGHKKKMEDISKALECQHYSAAMMTLNWYFALEDQRRYQQKQTKLVKMACKMTSMHTAWPGSFQFWINDKGI